MVGAWLVGRSVGWRGDSAAAAVVVVEARVLPPREAVGDVHVPLVALVGEEELRVALLQRSDRGGVGGARAGAGCLEYVAPQVFFGHLRASKRQVEGERDRWSGGDRWRQVEEERWRDMERERQVEGERWRRQMEGKMEATDGGEETGRGREVEETGGGREVEETGG